MNAFLLYPDREWNNRGAYFDSRSIIQDLSLNVLFSCAAKEVVTDKGKVTHIQKEDPYISETMRRVTMVPLKTEEEIRFRQEIMADCFARESFIKELYQLTVDMLGKWNKLGRKENTKAANGSPTALLANDIQVLKLFMDTLDALKELLDTYSSRLYSQGFIGLNERLNEAYPESLRENLLKILSDVAFYVGNDDIIDTDRPMVASPKITVQCGFSDGLKLSDIELVSIETQLEKYRSPSNPFAKLQDYMSSLKPNSFAVQKEDVLWDQSNQFEYCVVNYVIQCCNPFKDEFFHFFDELHMQSAFYLGIVNIKHHFLRFHLNYCTPSMGKPGSLHFEELKEPVMCMEQRIEAIGNDCDTFDQRLMIITGANQGGKSTFLRSLGIAQIMFQSGMIVAANTYQGAIYQDFFTHFTRREDSAMNSGRLDEELKRMSQIIDHVTPDSLILLNESFASTTEKEGSVIAYDIIKALTEAKVYTLTVTHLLSFATKVYEESQSGLYKNVAFLSAERLPDGTRTYKMLTHEPELTSFGLDLYNEIMEVSKEN